MATNWTSPASARRSFAESRLERAAAGGDFRPGCVRRTHALLHLRRAGRRPRARGRPAAPPPGGGPAPGTPPQPGPAGAYPPPQPPGFGGPPRRPPHRTARPRTPRRTRRRDRGRPIRRRGRAHRPARPCRPSRTRRRPTRSALPEHARRRGGAGASAVIGGFLGVLAGIFVLVVIGASLIGEEDGPDTVSALPTPTFTFTPPTPAPYSPPNIELPNRETAGGAGGDRAAAHAGAAQPRGQPVAAEQQPLPRGPAARGELPGRVGEHQQPRPGQEPVPAHRPVHEPRLGDGAEPGRHPPPAARVRDRRDPRPGRLRRLPAAGQHRALLLPAQHHDLRVHHGDDPRPRQHAGVQHGHLLARRRSPRSWPTSTATTCST